MTEPNKICSECDAHAIGGWYTTPLCQSCFAERGYFGPKKEAMQMTDITRKLELIANLRPKEMWPTELGPEFGETNNWCTALSAICAEALVEIQRLRAHERASEKWLAELMPYPSTAGEGSYISPVYPMQDIPKIEWSQREWSAGDFAAVDTNSLRPPTDEPKPEPWGSAFAMNTENWK